MCQRRNNTENLKCLISLKNCWRNSLSSSKKKTEGGLRPHEGRNRLFFPKEVVVFYVCATLYHFTWSSIYVKETLKTFMFTKKKKKDIYIYNAGG